MIAQRVSQEVEAQNCACYCRSWKQKQLRDIEEMKSCVVGMEPRLGAGEGNPRLRNNNVSSARITAMPIDVCPSIGCNSWEGYDEEDSSLPLRNKHAQHPAHRQSPVPE